MSKVLRKRGVGVLAVGLVVLGVAAAVAGAGGSASSTAARLSDTVPVTSPDAAVQQALGAFRRGVTQGDLVPVGVRNALGASSGVADVNPELARAVGPGGRLYLMPGDGQLCVGRKLDSGSVVYCAADVALTQGQFVGAVVHTADGLEVSGVVGDGASAVQIATTQGTIAAAAVDGAVLATVDAPPVSIAWVDRDGVRHVQPIGVPR